MKAGYELELLAPIGSTRYSIAYHFSQKYNLNLKTCFHRESEIWPGSNNGIAYYCLTKGFELWNNQSWQFRFINDMTIRHSLDASVPESNEWYHILTDDIRFIDLIQNQCDSSSATSEILKPISKLYKVEQQIKDRIYSVVGKKSKLICGAHSQMADRNRICEIVTAPITENHQQRLEEIIDLANSMGCIVPQEGAFHIHFDGTDFANSKTLLRMIRYFYVWTDVLKAMIPPNPYCTRLGEYSKAILDYAFDLANETKPFSDVVSELKMLAPTKYCDFNFNNILIGDPDKFTVEVRVIPMLLDSAALVAANDLYMSFLEFIKTTNHQYSQQKFLATEQNMSMLIDSF